MRSTTFACLAFLLVAPGWEPAAWGEAPKWVLIDENQGSSYFFNAGEAKPPKAGLVQVTTRVVYTDEGKREALKMLATDGKLANLYETRYHHEIDCDDMESRLLDVTHLDRQGGTLRYTNVSQLTDWEPVAPQARMSLVAALACR
ncbi:surface-adhesin E family protein [Geomonas sp. Red276]